ncbi:MAG: hypothetical protein N3A69_07910, partial [Leptospiraceae bacterium]|nr:hypothetical protein [Leptospiraceae bacterium]
IHEPNTPVVFEDLANCSQGDNSLGVLKADVDRLGYVLSTKFDNMSLSRLSTFSFLLDYFFSYEFINKVKRDFPNTYIVFAGGDDLFCLGPWDKIVKLSYLLQGEFRHWVDGRLTISCGVVLVDNRLPFYEMSRIVNDELSLAKKDKKRGKISIFGKPFEDKDLKEAFEIAYEISKLFDPEIKVEMRIPRNTFQKLIEIYYEWEYYQNDSSKQKLPMYAPHLAYLIHRTESLNPNTQKGRASSSLKELSKLLDESLSLSNSGKNMHKIGIISTFVLLLTRNIKETEEVT